MENVDKKAPALLKAQKECKKLVANKDNAFYNSTYADLHACIDACQDVLNKNNILIYQGFDHDAENNVFYVSTTLLHTSGQSLENQVGFPIVKKDPQAIGQLCTYGRRYGLTALMSLAEEDDDGNTTGNYKPKKVDMGKMAEDLAGF